MEKSIKKYWPIFVLPTFAAFIIGFIVPFIEGIYLSFCKFTTIRDASFVGLSNYVEAFKDNTFTHAFGFTAVFAVVTLVLINVLAFAIALALTQKIKGTNIFRTIFFMPNLIGGIVLGYIWQLIFDGIFEKFDLALKLSAKLGFWGLVILICWQQIGYMMIVYIAGLQAIPGSLNEAAMIDGANKWQRLIHVTIPNMMPSITILRLRSLLLSTLQNLQMLMRLMKHQKQSFFTVRRDYMELSLKFVLPNNLLMKSSQGISMLTIL